MSFNFGRGPKCWSCGEHEHGGRWENVGGGTDGYFCSPECLSTYRRNNPYEGANTRGTPTDADCAAEGMDKERRKY